MGSGMQNLLMTLLIVAASITAFILLIVFVAVPLFRGVGLAIGGIFRGIGWFFTHIFEFIGGLLSDIVRFVGSLLAMIVLLPMVPLNIVIGRWSAATHFAGGVKRECQVGAACVYRAVIRRPLKLLLLDGLLEGLEQRVPEAMQGAPGGDSPSKRTGQFDGYTILGSMRAGGSGAKLYIAQPNPEKQRKLIAGRRMPDRVVIKSFALTEGSSLPQIVRESRALECAKQLGHVLDHGMDEHRFYYVMPYHPGDHLGILTRQMHGECANKGLDQRRLSFVMSCTRDLLATLSAYHKGGLWHKDVKPENVIVHDGHAHLVDLGLVTPLRSAMTLTTHGTEYFRDPEMVRQALRGVKVHQVDGAKFDIYAVGAVLYFMIENTFPAHGGLSRFVANSPEALRWIIRRAMTDYHQRYETADQMLADLNYVAAARDAFAVKPAELPSMRGLADGAAVLEESAGSPQPFFASAAAPAAAASTVANEGSFTPKLKVTNWWTGEYQVDANASASSADAPNMHDAARAFRKQSFEFRQKAQEIHNQARMGAMTARRAAREQIKAARQRARELRHQAMAHRKRVVPRARNSASAVVIGILSMLFLGAILAVSFFGVSVHRLAPQMASAGSSQPVLLVLDAAHPNDPRLQSLLKSEIAKHRKRGYEVIVDQSAEQFHLLPDVREWIDDPKGPADNSIEDVLEARNAYGILYVKAVEDKRKRVQSLNNILIHSTRQDASTRRGPLAIQVPPAPALPYLLINDHPAKADPQIEKMIESQIKAYREHGWKIVANDDVEVNVRKSLPTGPIDQSTPMPPMLYSTLAQANFGGIVRISARQGEDAASQPKDRIVVTVIELENPPAVNSTSDENDEAAPVSLSNSASLIIGERAFAIAA